VLALLESERVGGVDLAPAQVGVSDADAIDTRAFRIVYPAGAHGSIVIPPNTGLPPSANQLAALEAKRDFRFPPSFRAFADDPPAAFRRVFPYGRFVAHARELGELQQGLLSPRLVPFLVDPQPAHRDYYCFDRDSPAPEHAVVVFAVHTTVASWPNFTSWLAWLAEDALTRS